LIVSSPAACALRATDKLPAIAEPMIAAVEPRRKSRRDVPADFEAEGEGSVMIDLSKDRLVARFSGRGTCARWSS
jgi:hypothetical protein